MLNTGGIPLECTGNTLKLDVIPLVLFPVLIKFHGIILKTGGIPVKFGCNRELLE